MPSETPLLPPDLRYLFFVRAGPPELHGIRDEAALLIVAAEGIPGEPEPGFIVPDARRITLAGSSATLRFYWPDCVSYAVRVASYAQDAPGERSSLLVERSDSAYLAFVRQTSDFPPETEPLRHWELSCLAHRIDVASTAVPRINVDAEFGSRWDPNR